MTIDYNYKDKNKDVSKKSNNKINYQNLVRSVVEKRNNFYPINLENQSIAETENPFTMIGLLTAIINDLNDLRRKVKVLEMYGISQNLDNFIVK